MSLNSKQIAKARKKIKKKGYYHRKYLDISKQLDEVETQIMNYSTYKSVPQELVNAVHRLNKRMEHYYFKIR